MSGDTYCERSRFIAANDEQRHALLSDETLWRTLVEQVANHNDTYKSAGCVDATDPAK